MDRRVNPSRTAGSTPTPEGFNKGIPGCEATPGQGPKNPTNPEGVEQAVVRRIADHKRDIVHRRGIGIERTTEPMPMPMPRVGRQWNHDFDMAAGFSLFNPAGVGGSVRMRPGAGCRLIPGWTSPGHRPNLAPAVPAREQPTRTNSGPVDFG